MFRLLRRKTVILLKVRIYVAFILYLQMSLTRLDNRALTQLRPLGASQSLLSRSDGSARFGFGPKTQVLASIVGPTTVQISSENLDTTTVEMTVRPLVGLPSTKDKMIEHALRTTFENIIVGGLFPRTLIQGVVQVQRDDGGVLPAAINAMTIALMNAGVPIRGVVAAVGCAIIEGEIVMDPTALELENAKSTHFFAFDTNSTNLETASAAFSESSGCFSEDEYFNCFSVCFEATQQLHAFMRTTSNDKSEQEY